MNKPKPKPRPRMPAAVREKLHGALTRIVNGPSGPITDQTKGAEFNEGMAAGANRLAGWRHSWIEHELRAVLAWADGAETATDIRVYDAGLDYLK